MRPAPVLVAGIGNIFLGDDGFGVEVVARLMGRALPEGVRVADFGIRGLDLAYALTDGCSAAILVDASPRGGLPGTVYILEIGPEHVPAGPAALETHGMDPLRVLRLADALGGRPARVFVVACEPLTAGDDDGGALGLSAPVAAAVDEAADAVLSLVARLVAEAPSPAAVARGA